MTAIPRTVDTFGGIGHVSLLGQEIKIGVAKVVQDCFLVLVMHSFCGFLRNEGLFTSWISRCFLLIGILFLQYNLLVNFQMRNFFPQQFVVQFQIADGLY
jgi:hypothetical protein